MNPLTNVKNITKLNENELAKGTKKSWHDMYKESAWIFIGGLAYDLTEGDILAVFSEYGEIVNINLIRDKKTGKTKGYGFLCYANQKSTILAVDNFNGMKLCKRTIRVDHVANYKPPKEDEKDDDLTKLLKSEGCAPKPFQADESISTIDLKHEKKKKKKMKKDKKEHKKKQKKKHSDDLEKEMSMKNKVKVKEEKHDPGYDKYDKSGEASTFERRLSEEGSHRKNLGEHSNSRKEHRSKVDKQHLKHKDMMPTRENIRHRSNSSEGERERSEFNQYRDHSKSGERSMNTIAGYKRSRSSSSSDSDSSSSSEDSVYEKKINKSKHKHHKHDNSSYRSTSDDESNIMSKNEKYERHDKSSYPQQSSRDKYDYRRENFDDSSSSKSKLYDKGENNSEHRSRDRYQNEKRSDKYHSNSHHSKSKYEKR